MSHLGVDAEPYDEPQSPIGPVFDIDTPRGDAVIVNVRPSDCGET